MFSILKLFFSEYLTGISEETCKNEGDQEAIREFNMLQVSKFVGKLKKNWMKNSVKISRDCWKSKKIFKELLAKYE